MSGVYYTYRVRVANPERVQVEKRNLQGDSLGEPNGAFGYKGPLRHKIDDLVRAAQSGALRGSRIKELGEALFQALFDDGLCHDFVAFYEQVVHVEDKLLRVELDIDEQELPEVAALPWEFMRLPTSANLGTIWLGTAPDLIFSRRRAHWFVPKRIRLEPDERLRIALAVAAPSDLGPVAYEEIWEALEKLAQEQVDRIELMELVNPATSEAIDEVLAQKPHIFHFIGHGRLLEGGKRHKGKLALVSNLGKTEWVEADYFSDRLNQHRPGIVFLQACEGGRLSASQAFVGVASQVVQQNIPVVVAMQYPVSNSTANRFAQRFYQRLAEDTPVDQAVQDGRYRIILGPKRYGARDFATPVLFMRAPDGHLFQRSEPKDISLFATNVELYDKVLYDRKKSLEDAEKILDGRVFGVWIQGSSGSGRTPLAIEIAHQCIRHKRLFSHCKYFSVFSEGKSKDSAEFIEFVYQAKLECPEEEILVIIDNWERFCDSKRKQLLDLLNKFLHDTGCKAIVVSKSEPEQSQGWRRVSGDRLDKKAISQFVDEYVLDGRPRVGDVLHYIGRSRWLADVYAATEGRVDLLWRFLEQIAWAEHGGAPGWQARCYQEALENTGDSSRAKSLVVQRVKRLDSDHKRIVKALSLFKGSASLDMLATVMDCSTHLLKPWLDKLIEKRLVRTGVGVFSDTSRSREVIPRYQLAIPKRETMLQELKEDPKLLHKFFEEWLDYVEKSGGEQRDSYSRLLREAENLESAFQCLWDVANVQVRLKPNNSGIEQGDPLPRSAFLDIQSSLEEKAAQGYIKLLEYLRDYFRFEGRWHDYRLSARRAYAAACALKVDLDEIAWQACQAAEAYSHEEWHTIEDLEIAEKWVTIMEEAVEKGGHVIAWPGLVLRMRGIIAMRHHDYDNSRRCFQDALKHFEEWDFPKQASDTLFYLAKLEMRYNPDHETGQAYEQALEYLEQALKWLKQTVSPVKDSAKEDEKQIVNRVQKAELLLWWGRWHEAAKELDEVLPLAQELGRKDLIAKCCYLQAFRYQNQSVSEANQDQRNYWLNRAIQQAKDALEIQKAAAAADRSLYLCRIYAVLAALHHSRWKMAGDIEDEKQSRDHLNNLDELLKVRQHFGPDNQQDPEANYEAACLKVLEGDMDRALDTLKGVVEIQPGCVIRAENDFRLDPLTQGAYRAKWEAVKAGLKSGEDSG